MVAPPTADGIKAGRAVSTTRSIEKPIGRSGLVHLASARYLQQMIAAKCRRRPRSINCHKTRGDDQHTTLILTLKLELSLIATDQKPKWLRKIASNWGFHWVGNINQTPQIRPAQTPNMNVGLSISPYLPHFRPSRPSANNR